MLNRTFYYFLHIEESQFFILFWQVGLASHNTFYQIDNRCSLEDDSSSQIDDCCSPVDNSCSQIDNSGSLGEDQCLDFRN